MRSSVTGLCVQHVNFSAVTAAYASTACRGGASRCAVGRGKPLGGRAILGRTRHRNFSALAW
jgi:hypothetical protein